MTIAAPTIISAEGIQQRQLFLEEESIAFKRAINREGIFLLGPRVQSLEGFLRVRYQVAQALLTNAGTAALELACEGLKERLVPAGLAYRQRANYWHIMLPGKNGKRAERPALISTPLSYIATAYVASRAGFDLYFADIDARGNLDPHTVHQAFTRHTNIVGILPVHLYGQPCDMAAFLCMALLLGLLSSLWLGQQRSWATVGERAVLARNAICLTFGLAIVWSYPHWAETIGLLCLLPLLLLDLLTSALDPRPSCENRVSLVLSTGEGLMTAVCAPVVGLLIDHMTVDKALIFMGVALAWFLVTVMVANAARITEQLFALPADVRSISVERAA